MDIRHYDRRTLLGCRAAHPLANRNAGAGHAPLEWPQHKLSVTQEIKTGPIDIHQSLKQDRRDIRGVCDRIAFPFGNGGNGGDDLVFARGKRGPRMNGHDAVPVYGQYTTQTIAAFPPMGQRHAPDPFPTLLLWLYATPVHAATTGGRWPRQEARLRKVIVTGCDSGYFPLVMELIQSINGRTDAALCVLDAGLSSRQVETLSDLGVLIRTPYVPPCASARQIRQRPTLAINLSKLWLDRVLPQFDLILWVDADAWVQDMTAIEHMFDAARDGALAIVPEIGAKIADMFAIRWICPGWMQVRSFLYKNARKARLPFAIRRRIGAKPLLNSGVMCLHRDAAIWPMLRKWQETIIRQGGALFTQDQLSIALAVYIDNARVTFLDNAHNYIGPWLLDEDRGMLVNLFYPHAPVGIVHLVSQARLRQSLSHTLPVPTLSGREVALNLRFGGLRAFRNGSRHPDGPQSPGHSGTV